MQPDPHQNLSFANWAQWLKILQMIFDAFKAMQGTTGTTGETNPFGNLIAALEDAKAEAESAQRANHPAPQMPQALTMAVSAATNVPSSAQPLK